MGGGRKNGGRQEEWGGMRAWRKGGRKEGEERREKGRGGGREGRRKEGRKGMRKGERNMHWWGHLVHVLIAIGGAAAGPSSFDGGGHMLPSGHCPRLFVVAMGGWCCCGFGVVGAPSLLWVFAFMGGC